jgi:hypothetical protein
MALDDLTVTSEPPAGESTERRPLLWFKVGPAGRAARGGVKTVITVAYAPRRTVVDKILVDAADHAGAEVRGGGLQGGPAPCHRSSSSTPATSNGSWSEPKPVPLRAMAQISDARGPSGLGANGKPQAAAAHWRRSPHRRPCATASGYT